MMVAVPMPPPVHMVIERGLLVGPLELVEGGLDEHAAGGADRVAERHRAAVDVDLPGVEVELADRLQHHRRRTPR